MAIKSQDWSTLAKDPFKAGSVTRVTRRVHRIEVEVERIDDYTPEDHIEIVVNGRTLARLNPYRARQMDIVRDLD